MAVLVPRHGHLGQLVRLLLLLALLLLALLSGRYAGWEEARRDQQRRDGEEEQSAHAQVDLQVLHARSWFDFLIRPKLPMSLRTIA